MNISKEYKVCFRASLLTTAVTVIGYLCWQYISPTGIPKTQIPWSNGIYISPWWDIISYVLAVNFVLYINPVNVIGNISGKYAKAELEFIEFMWLILSVGTWFFMSSSGTVSIKPDDLIFNPLLILPSLALTLFGMLTFLIMIIAIMGCGRWIMTGSFSRSGQN